MNWTDAAGNVTKPTDASMLATTGLAERMLPFPYLETTILGIEENRSGAFAAPSTASGGCNLAWQSLLSSLAITKIFTALFGLGDIVFGMVPNTVVPAGGGSVNSGCSIGSAGCIIGFNTSFAHELGHQYGRPHVAVAGDASSDPNYPNYGGDTKSIGEVGIDTGTSPPTLFDPATSDDLMSYGPNQWISPYTYQKIFDRWDLHAFVTADPRHVRSILVVGVRLHRGVRDTRRVEIRQAHLVAAAGLPPKHIGATISPLSIDLLDRSAGIPRHPSLLLCAGPWRQLRLRLVAARWYRRNASPILICMRPSSYQATRWSPCPSIAVENHSPGSKRVVPRGLRLPAPNAARAALRFG